MMFFFACSQHNLYYWHTANVIYCDVFSISFLYGSILIPGGTAGFIKSAFGRSAKIVFELALEVSMFINY